MTFDITERDIAGLVAAVQRFDVARFHLVTPDCEIYISRTDDAPPPACRSASGGAASAPTPTVASPAPAGSDPATKDSPDTGLVTVTSPMIGIFYTAPEPGAAPFVSVGATIEHDATVGLVEAMKLFTAVEAGVAGTVHDVLVANGKYVEFGQPLVRIRPAAQDG